MKLLSTVLALAMSLSMLAQESVPFTFHNSSLKSIPLVIPGVMNPNLSPMSDSGVNLPIGQKVFFKQGMKRVLLFEVTEDMRGDGTRQRLDIAALIRERKKELKA